MSLFGIVSAVGWTVVVVSAHLVRGRFFAIFGAVMLGIHSLSASAMAETAAWVEPLALVLQVATIAHFLLLLRPRMRGLAHRVLVNWPASFFVAGSFLAIPWSVATSLGISAPWPWAPFVVAALGMVQSFGWREEERDLTVGDGFVDTDRPRRHRDGAPGVSRPLRVVQITDPHLGPFMSVERLARIAARAVAREPDLVLLTGDYLTMESQADAAHLTEALAPLRALPGRVFACRGNHDHEAPELVARALAANGIRLLIDEEAVVATPAGPVQLVGADFHFRDRKQRLTALATRFPRRDGHLRLWLLHHPGAFEDLPEGDADLVLSGHTHGGHLGLVSLGIDATVVRLASRIPDHGFFARGRDRLYVHRGTCHYGFPLRIGVPPEQSLLRIHRADAGASELDELPGRAVEV